MLVPSISRVPVVPNASLVRGKLVRILPEGDKGGCVLEIQVDEAHDIGRFPNFVRDHIDSLIQVYVHPQLQLELATDDMLQAQVAFRGDERGGRFALINDEVHKL